MAFGKKDSTKDANGIHVTEQKVRGRGGSLLVKGEKDMIEIVLPNGTKREFTLEKLESTLAGLELLSDYEGIWIEVTDSRQQPLAVSLNKGRAFLEESPRAKTDYSVSWDLLQKALDKAVEEQQAAAKN